MKLIIRLSRILKGLLLFLNIHVFLSLLMNPMEKLINLAKLSRWRKQHPPKYIDDFYSFKIVHSKRYQLYEVLSKEELQNQPICYLEFGVAAGQSLRWWVNKNTNNQSRFVGFDTFTGLPEDWGPFKKGSFNNNNKPPEIKDDRVQFVQGLFQQTLHPFLENFQNENKLVVNMDADLYSSTLFVLTSIFPYLKKGDIIFFDEFNVPNHEFNAFMDFVNSYYISYEVLGAVNNYYALAIKILDR